MTPEGPESCGWSGEQAMAIRAQLERLTGSAVLLQSPRKQRLLRHIVDATLSGAADRLKGYTLGVEVFDRGAGFDPNIDPIVRVEMGRLRSKLIEFYSDQGATDRVLIELPKGDYAARIGFRVHDAAVTANGQTITLPAGEFNRVYVLAASAEGDQKATFK